MNPDPARRYQDVNALRLALADRKTNNIYLAIIAFLVAMIALLLWLNSPTARTSPQLPVNGMRGSKVKKDMSVTVKAIEPVKKALREYVNFGIDLYDGNDCFVPSLIFDEINTLIPPRTRPLTIAGHSPSWLIATASPQDASRL